MKNENLFALLRCGFPANLDAIAIETEDGLRYTWLDLERSSAMLANLLGSLALPAGARVAAHTDKSVEALLLYLATLRAGLVYLPLNNAYQAGELEHFIADAQPAVVVCARRNFPWISKLSFRMGVQHVFTLDDDRTGTLLDRAAQMPAQHEVVTRGADELAAILYTSGTTGRSKGAMLTHGNLSSNALTLKNHWNWRADDVLIHALPIFHVHGLFVATHAALLGGSTMLWLSKFEPRAVIERFERASVFMGVPTLYVRMLQEPSLTRAAASHMRLFISGSAPLLRETFGEWQQRTGHAILERYGMSETVMLTSNPCRREDGERVPGTVGRALPGVQVRVVDAKAPQPAPLAVGEIGDVQVKGPNVFRGYWNLPEKTAQEFTADGWFKTGDVGRLDDKGYLSIVGRSKDLIITGGFNVYPAEVEAAINELPGVAESAVVGVAHPDFGEGVIAVVVTREGIAADESTMLGALKSRIANFKVPKRMFFVKELPRNAMGKVQKVRLREMHAQAFEARAA